MLEQLQDTEPQGPYEGLFDNDPQVRLNNLEQLKQDI